MSNSKNNNLEEGSKGTDESAPRANDSASNKKTRFTKSKSISEVFHELEFEDETEEDSYNDDSSVDEIIPIHNEYRDLEEHDSLDEESIEGGVIINPDLDEANLEESAEYYDEGSVEMDSLEDETDADEFSESTQVIEDMDDEDSFITGKNSDNVLAEEALEEKIGRSSQGVLINKNQSSNREDKSFDPFNSSTIITILGFIVGFAILIIGITYYASSSDRVVDNVLSGETAGLAIFLVIIGLIIIGFSLLKLFSSSKSSLIIDTFNSIKSIDYDEISEDVISREDFDAIFGVFKRNKDSNFSDNDDQSVDSSKDLAENDDEEKVSDDDIDSLYSKSNLTSQKNQSSFKEHENANSTEILEDNDDEVDEIIPIHSRLNEQSDEPTLEDKYSKYDFEEDSDDEYDLAIEDEEDFVENSIVDSDDEYDLAEDSPEDSILDANEEYDLVDENFPVEEETVLEDTQNPIEEAIEDDFDEESDDASSELEDKYSKYDFDEESDEEIEEPIASKPQFKKSVDLSKFDHDDLSEEELAEKERKAKELEEKKARIIEGTNFDNSLREN